jgi:hypothetical protein
MYQYQERDGVDQPDAAQERCPHQPE